MTRHRKTRREKRKQKKIVVISALCLFLLITVGYAAFSTNLSITAKGNVKDKSRVIQEWDSSSQSDFHSDYYKQNIVSATFLDNANVPSNATESWNVSEDQKHGGVMAWVVPNSQDMTKYDLYIGAKDGVIANENSSWLFFNFKNILSINFNNNFDTSNAILMGSMFKYCTSISTIDLSSFDTINVTDMSNMFCMYDNSTYTVLDNKLTNIIFGNEFTVENVTNLEQMFCGCKNLSSIDVSNWNTSNVISMLSVFAFCSSLTEIDVSNWNTSKVETMQFLFTDCSQLKEIDLSNFNTDKVDNMEHMFRGCSSLTSLNLCSFNTSKVTNMTYMFYGTKNIKNIYVGPNWTTVNVTNTKAMFTDSGVSSVTTGQC